MSFTLKPHEIMDCLNQINELTDDKKVKNRIDLAKQMLESHIQEIEEHEQWLNSFNKQKIPSWFNDFMVDRVDEMYVLGLPNAPAAENLSMTCKVWIKVLWSGLKWEVSDLERLSQAILTVMRKAERFPTPADILEAIPRKRTPEFLCLPAPKPTKEEIEMQRQKDLANVAKLKESLSPLYESLQMEKHVKAKEEERKSQLAREHEARRKMDWATRMDFARMKTFCEAHAGVICPHSNQTCNIYLDLRNLILKVEHDVQSLENIENDVPAFIIPEPEPTKKSRRKKATV